MSMREKIARAIFDAWAKSVKAESTWDDVRLMNGRPGYGEAKRIYKLAFDEADAVLEALEEPTEEMQEMGDHAYNLTGICGQLTPSTSQDHTMFIWRAMIQAARSGK